MQYHFVICYVASFIFYFATLGPYTNGYRYDGDRLFVGIATIGIVSTSFVAAVALTSCEPLQIFGFHAITANITVFGFCLGLMVGMFRNPTKDSYSLRPIPIIIEQYSAALWVIMAASAAVHLRL